MATGYEKQSFRQTDEPRNETVTNCETDRLVSCGSLYFKISNGRRVWLSLPPDGYMMTDGTKFKL